MTVPTHAFLALLDDLRTSGSPHYSVDSAAIAIEQWRGRGAGLV